MELSFNTLEILAKTGAFDVWYLFPLNSATRSLRNDGDIDEPTEERLNRLLEIMIGKKSYIMRILK